LEIKVLLCALVLMLYCVLVRSVRYCWSTWLSFVRRRLKSFFEHFSNGWSVAAAVAEPLTSSFCLTDNTVGLAHRLSVGLSQTLTIQGMDKMGMHRLRARNKRA